MFQNKKIFILAMARSGFEAAKLLAGRNNQILITDCKEQDKDKILKLRELGVNLINFTFTIKINDMIVEYINLVFR